MARKSKSADEWIHLLQAKLKLVESSETFSLSEFAEVCEISAPAFRTTYIDPDPEFPLISMGSEGTSYVINGVAALKHLISRFETQKLSSDERRARVAQLASVKPEMLDDDTLTLSELREAERMLMGTRKLTLEDQGRVSLVDHERTVADLCLLVSEDYGSVGPEINAAGLWDDALTKQIEDYFYARQLKIHEKFKRYLTDDGDGASDAGARVSKARERETSS